MARGKPKKSHGALTHSAAHARVRLDGHGAEHHRRACPCDGFRDQLPAALRLIFNEQQKADA